MEALNVQISKSLSTNQILHTSDRSSFSEVNGHGNSKSRDRVNIAENNLSVDRRAPRSKSGSPYAVMAPVKHVPIRVCLNDIFFRYFFLFRRHVIRSIILHTIIISRPRRR